MWQIRNELSALNAVNLVLAALLLISPWVVGFRDVQFASWNAWIAGLAMVIVAGAAMIAVQEWEEWVSGALGLWTLIAPWVLGFAHVASALWTHIGVGLAVAILAAVELWLIHNGPPARTA
jgi:hypothetical protein